jgi:uncharacterized phage protein (TIGR01671 family)
MNRVIKFRAWDDKTKRFISDIDNTYIRDDGSIKRERDGYGGIWLETIDVIIEQFTGLLDKNGKEIYEGDIISIPDDWEESGFNAGENYQVIFAFGGFRLKPKYQKKAKGSYLEDDKIKVIGNIHENPELLEGK